MGNCGALPAGNWWPTLKASAGLSTPAASARALQRAAIASKPAKRVKLTEMADSVPTSSDAELAARMQDEEDSFQDMGERVPALAAVPPFHEGSVDMGPGVLGRETHG